MCSFGVLLMYHCQFMCDLGLCIIVFCMNIQFGKFDQIGILQKVRRKMEHGISQYCSKHTIKLMNVEFFNYI